jgi:hypothetical protein
MERPSTEDLDAIPVDLCKCVNYHAELQRDDALKQQRQGGERPTEQERQGEEQSQEDQQNIPQIVVTYMRQRVSPNRDTPMKEIVRIYREQFLHKDVIKFVHKRFEGHGPVGLPDYDIIKNFEERGLLPNFETVETASPYEKVPGGGKKRPSGMKYVKGDKGKKKRGKKEEDTDPEKVCAQCPLAGLLFSRDVIWLALRLVAVHFSHSPHDSSQCCDGPVKRGRNNEDDPGPQDGCTPV